MKKRYQVMIDDTVLPQSFSLDELLGAGLLDDYDTNIKVRATNETKWRVAREYPFYPKGYIINEYGEVVSTGTMGNSNASRLELSTDSLCFTSSGGSCPIRVTAGGEWHISLNAASWVLLSKSGGNLTVRVDQNYGSDSRTDYFRLKSGNMEKEIKIYQSGCSSGSSTMPTSSNDNDGCAWLFWVAIGIGVLVAIFS